MNLEKYTERVRGFIQSAQQYALNRNHQQFTPEHKRPPLPLDAAIIFAPVGALVPAALRAIRKGGRVVCGGIH